MSNLRPATPAAAKLAATIAAVDTKVKYWAKTPDELWQLLHSSAEGLSQTEAEQRLETVGANVLKARRQVTSLKLFLNQFKSPIVLILIFATLMSAFLQDWPDAIIILLIVMGSAILSFTQENNAHNAAEKLRAQLTIKTNVLRDGQIRSVSAEEVVPGDIVSLSAGSLVPADGVIITAKDFYVSQAVLTGETFPVEKFPGVMPEKASLVERTNMVFMGTNVRSGSATVLISTTGIGTAFGQIAAKLNLRPPETEFERGIRRLGYLLTEFMLVLVIAIFALNVYFNKPILDSLLFSVALAVGLTPQLLPAIININLSRGSQIMAKLGVIVRRLESLENFGSMDTLCTDKTGTLTLGVVNLDNAMDPQGNPSQDVFRYAYLNAHFQTGMANPLDDAIVVKQIPDISGIEKVDEIPYDFNRKRLTVVIRDKGQENMVIKGAFENIINVCSLVLINGQSAALDKQISAQVEKRYQDWSQQGFRVLGVAIKAVASHSGNFTQSDEKEMTFIGFLLFFDPPKPAILKTIQDLEQLGVQLKIITGDNHLVARHTADAVGLQVTGVVTGDQLDDMQDPALIFAVQHNNIFAEVDPAQKDRIILGLKKAGQVVGYMGDGINDAPSLHSADVGISVDNAVDVAKEAADFVLLKTDLEVLRQGIVQGRKTFANTLKYVFMATSANFGNMFSVAGASLFLSFLPMLPKQILLINFLTDLPEMTIATDNVDDVFIQKPHRWDVAFIRRFMLVFGPLSSVFDFLTFGMLLLLLHADQRLFHTGWFIESVLSAALVVYAVRTRLPFIHSKPSRAMMLVTLLVGLVTLVLPYSPLASILGFKPLNISTLGLIAVIIILYFISAELVKRWFYHRFFT
jgi:Mg2+-importing ATPase